MYLSLHASVTAGRVAWPGLISLAADAGYAAVDVNVVASAEAGLERTRQQLRAAGVRPGIINFPVEFRKDEATFKKDLDRLEELSAFSAALGCPRMATWIVSSAELPKDEQRRLMKRRFTEVARILQRAHVRLGLEFLGPLHIRKRYPYEFIWQMNEMLAFARECGPNLGLLLDSWHWHHAGATLEDILRAGADGIVHIHFNDAAPLPPDQVLDSERLMPGEGVINLKGFLHALEKAGYRDSVSVEVFGRGLRDMAPLEGASLASRTATGVFKDAELALS
jgi:sugar phosphate isomerase/epimerase